MSARRCALQPADERPLSYVTAASGDCDDYHTRMASVIKSVSFDAHDALVLATFWAAALGSDVDEDSTADKAFVEAAGWGGPNIWFTRVPQPKSANNRPPFQLRAPGPKDGEVRG